MCSEATAISVSGLSKRYQMFDRPVDRLWHILTARLPLLNRIRQRCRPCEFDALRGVSFDVARGETVGIIGRNGSGKSTLLQLICGTLYPSAGTVAVKGRVAALLELGSGFNPEFSGRENVFLNASVLGLSYDEISARFDSIAAFADIGEFLDRPLKTYSSGMAMRLAFAVIVHVDADILVIDEALAVGDALFTQKCMRFLRQFMRNGTVLFVSHDVEAVKALCQRVVWLHQGVVQRVGSTKEVCQDYQDALFRDATGPTTAVAAVAPERGLDLNLPLRDPRLDWLNASERRNDIKLFGLNASEAGFGVGGARIRSVRMLDTQGHPLSWVIGGELVVLEILVECQMRLDSPIVGFMVKDRTGQALFGDNTYLRPSHGDVAALAGDWLRARFRFEMPRLPHGDYSTVVAVVDGTQDDCVQLHWLHDALPFQSTSTSVASGLIGIPMRQIDLGIVSTAGAIDDELGLTQARAAQLG